MTARGFIAKEIRRAREEKGMTQEALANAVYVSSSLIAAWETGRRAPMPQYMGDLIRALDLDELFARVTSELAANVPPEWLGKWLDIERHATSLLWFETVVVPGLLQTDHYARALLQFSKESPLDLEEQLTARLARQEVLENDVPPMLVAILDECVLRRPVGGPEIMHDQLMRLVELAQRPEIVIQVVPLKVGAHPALSGSFILAGLDGNEVAYVESEPSGSIVTQRDEVASIRRTWESLRAYALPQQETTDLILEAAESWT